MPLLWASAKEIALLKVLLCLPVGTIAACSLDRDCGTSRLKGSCARDRLLAVQAEGGRRCSTRHGLMWVCGVPWLG
jgi:hypothetical protein